MLRSAGNGLCRVSGPPIRHDYVLASVLPEILEKSHANFRSFSTFINSQFLIQG